MFKKTDVCTNWLAIATFVMVLLQVFDNFDAAMCTIYAAVSIFVILLNSFTLYIKKPLARLIIVIIACLPVLYFVLLDPFYVLVLFFAYIIVMTISLFNDSHVILKSYVTELIVYGFILLFDFTIGNIAFHMLSPSKGVEFFVIALFVLCIGCAFYIISSPKSDDCSNEEKIK